MKLTTSSHRDVTVIHLQGNLMGGPDATALNTKLHELVEAGKKQIVIDLRGNGGGALSEAIEISGLFIDQGPVVQVKDTLGSVQRRDDPEKGTVYGGPLVVLVSRQSASARYTWPCSR